MLQPVAGVEEKVAWRKLVARGDVPVRENKALDIRCLQQLTGKLHLKFVLALKLQHAFIVGVSTLFRTKARNGERLPRMQHAVQPLVELVVENPLDEQVLALFAPQSITVTYKTAVPVDVEQSRFTVDYRPERLREIVLHPHVVVARKIMDFNTLRV